MLDVFLFLNFIALRAIKVQAQLFACVLSFKVQNEKQREKNPTTARKHGWLCSRLLS